MRARLAVFGSIVLLALAARFCHLGILWVEEAYPTAAALELLRGKTLYRDIWFDKPPLFALSYLLWGASTGWPLRLAGACFVALSSLIAYLAARRFWSEREGLFAAALLAFFLTSGVPSAVIALTPDLLLLPLHVAAVWMAATGRPFLAGLLAGLALLINTKAVLVLAACALWQWRAGHRLLSGFLAPQILAAAWFMPLGALGDYWQQVWAWGFTYSRHPPFDQPLLEGLRRTLNWTGFHLALLPAAFLCLRREPRAQRLRLAAWFLIALAGVALGWRFFPRYYFHLLPVAVLLAARGFALAPKPAVLALCLLLTVPLVRYAPRYALLARDLVTARPHDWRDLALEQDSREAARLVRARAAPGDNLLVWGYRPELFPFTQLPAATRYLDSQPLSGVLADRHLVSAAITYSALAVANRQALQGTPRPTWIIDGLGPLNPALEFFRLSGFSHWSAEYEKIASTRFCIIYRRIAPPH